MLTFDQQQTCQVFNDPAYGGHGDVAFPFFTESRAQLLRHSCRR